MPLVHERSIFMHNMPGTSREQAESCLEAATATPTLPCRLDGWQGEVNADPAEVHAWKFASVADVLEDMRANEQLYTPWFRAELHATVS